MADPKMKKIIAQCIKEVIGQFSQKKRLGFCYDPAYLIATSKFEMPFRDLLACALRAKLKDKFETAREYRRRDIQIFDKNGREISQIELKAVYDFDAFKKRQKKSILRGELRRLSRQARKGYSIMLITRIEIQGEVDKSARKKALRSLKYINSGILGYQKQRKDQPGQGDRDCERAGYKKIAVFQSGLVFFERFLQKTKVSLSVWLK